MATFSRNGSTKSDPDAPRLETLPKTTYDRIRLTVRAALAPREDTKHRTWSHAVDIAYLNDGKWSRDNQALYVPVGHMVPLAKALLRAWEDGGKLAQASEALAVYTPQTDRAYTASVETVTCPVCRARVPKNKIMVCGECAGSLAAGAAPAAGADTLDAFGLA